MKNQSTDITMLLEACAANNEKAQIKVYNLYYKSMFNVAYRIVGDSNLAEDVMQESFLKAFTKLNSFSGKVTFGAWLKKIVINQSINEFNKSKKQPIEDIAAIDMEEYTEDEVDYSHVKAAVVYKTLQSLKPNYKIILTLFFIEGYDLEEITSILGISYENCRTMMSRAKVSFKNKLKHYD